MMHIGGTAAQGETMFIIMKISKINKYTLFNNLLKIQINKHSKINKCSHNISKNVLSLMDGHTHTHKFLYANAD